MVILKLAWHLFNCAVTECIAKTTLAFLQCSHASVFIVAYPRLHLFNGRTASKHHDNIAFKLANTSEIFYF